MRKISLLKHLVFSVIILLSVATSASRIAPANSFSPTPTPALNPASKPVSSTSAPSPIVDTSSLTGWGQSSSASQEVKRFTLGLAQGRTDNALQISYDLEGGGWVSIWKAIDPQVLSGTTGISFFYKGSGASNTIEFKLRLLYPGDTEETYFYTSEHISTNTGGKWKLVEVPYSSFTCKHPGSNCVDARTGKPRALDLAKVVKIDIAIANKNGDKAGFGTVLLDEVVGFSASQTFGANSIAALKKYWGLVFLGVALVGVLLFVLWVALMWEENTGRYSNTSYGYGTVYSPPGTTRSVITSSERQRREFLKAQGWTGRTNPELHMLNCRLTDSLSNDEIRWQIREREAEGKPTGQLRAAARDRGIHVD